MEETHRARGGEGAQSLQALPCLGRGGGRGGRESPSQHFLESVLLPRGSQAQELRGFYGGFITEAGLITSLEAEKPHQPLVPVPGDKDQMLIFYYPTGLF